MAKNYKLQITKYLRIEKNDYGYDYSLYDRDKKLIDGGIIENTKLEEADVIKEITKIQNLSNEFKFYEVRYDIEEDIKARERLDKYNGN